MQMVLDTISVSLGESVSVGTKLGEVGETGGVIGSKKNPKGCHAHCVLYQNINSMFSETETGLQRLQSGLNLGFSEEKNKKNDFATNLQRCHEPIPIVDARVRLQKVNSTVDLWWCIGKVELHMTRYMTQNI